MKMKREIYMTNKWDYITGMLVLLFIVSLVIRFIKVRKMQKSEQKVVAIKRFAPIGIFSAIIGLIQAFFWVKHLIEAQCNYQNSPITSSGLAFITLALSCVDYNFITKDGLIILGHKYKWDSIQNWHWKKDHYNVVILNVFKPNIFLKKSQIKLRIVELNVSQKQRNDADKLLIQYIGKGVV